MYRNQNKSKLVSNFSSEHTTDTFKFNKSKYNTSLQTTSSHRNKKSIDESKEESDHSLPPIIEREKEKVPSKFKFKIKFIKNTNNNDIIRKKVIKGKLMKLINNSFLELDTEEEENKVIRPKKKNYITVDFFPNLIGKDTQYVRRNFDILTTPEELIFSNFNEEEIELIKSNANYFKINNNDHFRNIEIFKNRHLIEILDEEEEKKIIKKKEICKTIFSPLKIKEMY